MLSNNWDKGYGELNMADTGTLADRSYKIVLFVILHTYPVSYYQEHTLVLVKAH